MQSSRFDTIVEKRRPTIAPIGRRRHATLRAMTLPFIAGALALVYSASGLAQSYPRGPVTVVVPFAAGAATDIIMRTVANKLSPLLGQPVVTENRPGAAAQIGTEIVAKAKPDGYTLLMATTTSHSSNPSQVKNLRYDPIKDFAPITRLDDSFNIMIINSALPITDVKGFIAYAKANPNKVSYAWVNAAQIVGMETIRHAAGNLDIVGVPYKSNPQALNDVMAGQVQTMMVDLILGANAVKSGKVRAIGVGLDTGSDLMPSVPPIADTIPGYDIRSWQGVVAPAGTPKPVIDRLFADLKTVLADKEVKESLAKMGIAVRPSQSPAEFAAFMEQQLAKWTQLNAQAGIKPE